MDLNPLGRKGYSVPKVGTIQVVSEGVPSALRELMWEERRISQLALPTWTVLSPDLI